MNINVIMLNLVFSFLLVVNLFAQEVVINEVMSNNTMTLADEDSDYSDWIEIYNARSTTIHLQNYGLSDDRDNLFRWIFPDISLAPAGYLLIYASGKNKPGLVIHLESVIDWGDDWKYFPGYSEPPADWIALMYLPITVWLWLSPRGEKFATYPSTTSYGFG